MNEEKRNAYYSSHLMKKERIPLKTIPEMLQDTVSKYPHHSAISFYGQKTTYQQLNQSVQLFASSLQRNGVQKGDRIAIMLPNCPQYVISYYGALTVGGIVTQVNPMSVERELEYVLVDSGAKTIIVLDAFYPIVKKVQSNTDIKSIIVVSLQSSSKSYETDYSFSHFLSMGDGGVHPVEISPEHDIAILQYTGGTTGRSKGAMLTHQNLFMNVFQSYEFFKEEIDLGREKYLTVIPLFHVYGMTSCMNFSIFVGSESIMLPRFDLDEVLQTIKLEQPTVFPGVPTMYIAIINHPNAKEFGIDSIKICNSGSAPMPVELMKEFEKKTGAKVLEGYGLSEASPVTHCNPLFSERKPGSVGIPYPYTESKIVDLATSMEEVEAGELGELIIKGPQVMKGYWNMAEETAHSLRNGWLYTGDIAKVDEDGYVYIVDRKKDMIIASGYNIYPRDIEEIIYEHPGVQETVVIGVPDQYRGETVKAVIVPKSGISLTVEEIISYCKLNMAAYKVPQTIEFRRELPKTSVGKILRRALREEMHSK
ncbi:long-chain-fatty-acid--CoA ligase [Falsibacillus albus]|uniref:Long-chain fatty acid--CoA ligase n=1 Tax=Falsibacillus albus TaxID=2478915 RepID=A0A3L7K0I9_9BACI|nr:long-chain fatty acid--CoA ligase [Falsibacillus albus]RLQ96105.1 long-chain fatty acid--CoA ligase [Falsibacillus albus]